MTRLTGTFVGVALSVLASQGLAQATRTVYIDPMSANGPASWNNFSFGVSNNTAVLKDSLTNSTGIRATVTRNMNPGANTNGSLTPGGDAAEFAPAGGNSAYGHTTYWPVTPPGTPPLPYSEVVFSNLSPNVGYTFTFYASRMSASDNREAVYTVTGSNTLSAALNAANNSTLVAAVTNVYPSANGVVTLGMQKGPNNNNANGFYYITAMKIVYTEPPPTVVYVDAAGTSAPAGWNLLNFQRTGDTYLTETNGAATGIRAIVFTPLGNINDFGAFVPVGDAAEFASAGTQAAYANGATAMMRLFHLKPALPYTFTFFASRINSPAGQTRQAFYTVSGSSTASNNLEAANNTQEVAVVSGIMPATDGTITVTITRGLTNSTGFTYLTAFKVSYVDNGLPSPQPEPITGKRLLFFGSQYSSTEDVPGMVANLAQAGGHARPFVVSDFGNDRTFADQLGRVDGYPGFNVDYPLLDGTNTWDHVVLQGGADESCALGDVTAFRTNALALYQRVKAHASGKGAGSRAVLFQTWARGLGGAVYPGAFADPASMQAEIRGNYAFATNHIAAAEGAGSVGLAPVGDAFEAGGFDPATLYAANLSTPGNAGSELAALVLYKTLYGGAATAFGYDAASAAGLTSVTERDWLRVTHWADGLAAPEPQAPGSGESRVYLLDAGGNPAGSPVYMGWNYKAFTATGIVENLVLTNGYATSVSCEVLQRMSGTAVSDANPTGDAALFARALANCAFGNIGPWGTNPYSNEFCVVRFRGLSTMNAYTFTLYASRPSATGRETVYLVEGDNSGSATLEPGNNSTQVAVVHKIRPKPDGSIDLRITAGPNNTSAEQFYYINALMIESTRTGLILTVR